MKSGDTLLSWLNHAITIACFLVIAQTGGAIQLPRFTNTPLNVTAQKGGEAVLRCGIDHLGTKTVGWRKLPYNVPITIGKEQYLEYNRFKLVRVLHLGEWNLHIKNAQTFDSGVYECQVSSKDNPLRRNITLTVTDLPDVYIEPSILVTGTEFVEKGSPIKLLCNVTERNDPQRSPDWFKDGIRLQTSNDRVYIQLQATHSDRDILSWLNINQAQMSDTGIYVCRASQNLAARFKVDVLNTGTYNEKRDLPDVYIEPSILVTGTEFVEKGSPIKLLCNVTERNDPQRSLDWFKDGVRLQTSNDRVYIQLQATHSDKDTVSQLDINQAQMSDTGIYVCWASQKLAARIEVNVINDTQKGGALVYSRNSGTTLSYSPVTFLTLLSLLISVCMRASFHQLHISRQFYNSGNSS